MNIVKSQTFAERLKVAISDESVHSFARRTGSISDSAMRRYFEGSMPGVDNLVAISRTAGVSLDWLATGQGSMRPGSAVPVSIGEDLTLIQRLDIQAAAGTGMYIDSEQSLDYMAFQTGWLRRKGLNPDSCRLLNIRGDSMEPTIRDGDIALVDMSINDIIDNAIYVLMVGNRLLIKRIHVMVTGALKLMSDNQFYPPELVPESESSFVRVSGRVVWFGRSI